MITEKKKNGWKILAILLLIVCLGLIITLSLVYQVGLDEIAKRDDYINLLLKQINNK